MFGDNTSRMPIGFAMEMAHNKKAFSVFLRSSNEKQNEIIEKAREIKNIREMNRFVNSIGNMQN